jgi:predicted RNA-binding Zn-ribbon protein involved in translation (DUF1610 family)
MPAENQPIEQQRCPKCDKVTLVRTGMTRDDGKIVKHIRCHTCGYEVTILLSD